MGLLKDELGFYLKSVKRTTFPNRFLFIDTETLKYREYNLDLHRMRLAITCYIRLDKTPYNIKYEMWREFYTQREVCDYIERLAYDKMPLWIVTSNPKFDIGAIAFIKWFTEWKWKLDFIGESGLTFILQIKKRNKLIKIVALQNYFTTSIQKIGELIGLPKLDTDVFTDNMNELKEYCTRDTEILKQGFLKYVQFVVDNDLGNFALTKAGQSFMAYRRRFMSHKILIHRRENISKFERSAYHGGRVECFRIGKQPVKDYIIVDVNSLYPYVMRNNYYPIRLKGHIEPGNLKKLELSLSKFCVTARVLLDTNEPVYAHKMDKKCCFPVGMFYETLNTRALLYALEHKHIKKVICGYYYEKGYMFKRYINYFWKLRVKAQAEKNKVMSQLIKYFMNSLYGKWAQQVPETIEKKDEPTDKFEIEYGYNNVTKQYTTHRTMFHVTESLRGKIDGKKTNVGISAHITEDARMHLWSLLKECGIDNVLYCDTDSLIIERETYNRVLKKYIGSELGMLKIEKESQSLMIYTLKDYEFGTKIVRKGVGKAKQLSDDNTYSVLTGYGMSTLLKLGIKDAAILTPITKKLSRIYTKGTVNQTGLVAPFRLNELDDLFLYQSECF